MNKKLFPLVLVFLLSGCAIMTSSTSSPNTNGLAAVTNTNISNEDYQKNKVETELNENRRLWKESKIANYNFVCIQHGGGLYPFIPVLIKVKNDQAVSKKPVGQKTELVRDDGYENFDTVEKIFDKIQEAYDKGAKVIITYNKELGYPEETKIDSMQVTDGGWSIQVTKFERTKPN